MIQTARICALSSYFAADHAEALAGAERVFWATSSIKLFASHNDQAKFCVRWFRRYADLLPSEFLLAWAPDGKIAGYLTGCLNSFSAQAAPILDDIDYYTPPLIKALAPYPSHFHVNVHARYQGLRIGTALVHRFMAMCRDAGSPGIHVVTAISSPALNFYRALNFVPMHGAPVPPALVVLKAAVIPPQVQL